MATRLQSRLLPLPALKLLLLAAAAATLWRGGASAEEQRRPITLKCCQSMCGNISVPFPFGMEPGCFVEGFQVTCNNSFDPPRLFLFFNRTGGTSFNRMGEGMYSGYTSKPTMTKEWYVPVELMGISIAESFRLRGWLSHSTYHTSSMFGTGVKAKMMGDAKCYTGLSPTCEAALSKRYIADAFYVEFEPRDIMLAKGSPCSYGMVVQSSWYNFAFRDGSCPYGDVPVHPGYKCVNGNSSCVNATSAEGYFCKCWEHYDGNPYIPNGCQDINECELRKQSPHLRNDYPCDGVCKNRLGGYDCPCKPGMKGDGVKGTCTEKFPLAAKVVVGIAAMIVVFVLMVMVHQLLKFRRFYEQNGGPVLKGVKNIRIYTRKQIKQMTNNYRRVIEEGHFGKVYMGTLKDKQKVAIKKSIEVDKHMKKEFTDEVIIQSAMMHKNTGMLLGCCLELDVPMLVYEFMCN